MKNKNFFIFPLILIMTGCAVSEKIVLDSESRDFYEKTQIIMSKEEKKIFKHLPDKESRESFIKEFWANRDLEPDTEENEFKKEFFRRVEYASKYFREGKPGWKTDRGRIYIIFGPPDKIERQPSLMSPNEKALLLWIYYGYNFAIKFVDRRGNGVYTFDPYSGVYGDFFDASERVISRQTSTAETGFDQRSIDFSLVFNDKKDEIEVSVPVKDLIFIEEDGLLKADFEFEFSIYEKVGIWGKKISEEIHFEKLESEVLDLKILTFTFPLNLPPGNYYFDVNLTLNKDFGKARKIFEISVIKNE